MIGNTIDKTVGILQVLTDKLSEINDKVKENTLLNQEYEDLNNKLNTLSAMFNSNNSSSSESDLVALGILPKPISEFTNDDIGMEISIPYTDDGGVISGPIIFEVVGVNHHISQEHQQTITLMTKNAIRYAAFDAEEPNNPVNERINYGNNRWSISNIRQWLNSDGAANSWFTPQYEYDEAPTIDKVTIEAGAYTDEPGFLAGFSPEVLQHFTDITNTTAIHIADGGGSETTVDKVFLASYTEMFGLNNDGIAEGTHLSVRYPNDNSRIKRYTDMYDSYWLRSQILSEDPGQAITVDFVGTLFRNSAHTGNICLAPLIVLH